MLKTLAVSGYRGFESYRVTDLTRVNLMVGKNNSGKTSILEAVELLVSEGHLSVFYGSARRRGELSTFYSRGQRPEVSHLFYGHKCDPGAHFKLSSDDGTRILTVKILSLDDAGEVDWWRSRYRPALPEPTFALSIASGAPEKETLIPVADNGAIIDSGPVFRRNRPFNKPVRFLALDSLENTAMREVWNQLVAGGQEAEIVKDMELFLPHIDSIHFLAGDRVSGPGILVGRRGASHRVPIGSFGDGVRRLLAFRLSLVGTANGFLLIDEVDTGLHWTVMEDVWRLLIEVAARSNVQIFATTHSYDCIRGLGTLVRDRPDLAEHVSIHKLDKLLNRSVTLRGDQIPVAVEQEIEVR